MKPFPLARRLKLIIAVVASVIYLGGCSDVTLVRRYRLDIVLNGSPGANVALVIAPDVQKTNPTEFSPDVSLPLLKKENPTKDPSQGAITLPGLSPGGSLLLLWTHPAIDRGEEK